MILFTLFTSFFIGKFKSLVDATEKEITDLKDLANTIKEKAKFLSEGKELVSPVQVMAIQLEVSFIV